MPEGYDDMGMEDDMEDSESDDVTEAPEGTAPNTIFLSKEMLGGKTVKEGDTLTLTIKSIDPETGDAEGAISGTGSEKAALDETDDIGMAFDSAMPPEPGME